MQHAHILIVEDEAVLYDRLAQALLKEHFSVADYTPSVAQALIEIEKTKPDVVLLDVHLRGERSGLDLGKILSEKMHIPFIYVTKYADTATFFKGLQTNHEQFIVKTKPKLNIEEVVRAIHTTLSRKQKNPTILTEKKGVMGLTDYLDELKEKGYQDISRVPILYDDIAFFTVKSKYENNPKKETENLRANYLWFQTVTGKEYYLKTSLRKLQEQLPEQFERINESYIVNLDPHVLEGRINGSRLAVAGMALSIKETYKDAVRNKIEALYLG
ncbi:response regulator [Dokdonia sinensis]|uniref:Response regulator n=1 Tax=Dokdonia sinensis TaxID=2479847 RepID=A0A3M0FZA8_9FLAO|nr:response regulator [Dokdonia sinensis]RMB58010.1 response regulator [Dokdonia sinensis]